MLVIFFTMSGLRLGFCFEFLLPVPSELVVPGVGAIPAVIRLQAILGF